MPQRMTGHRLLLGLLTLGLLAGAALTTGPAQADTGIGPLYAEPAWDQKIGVATRYLILSNWASQAVLDKETGLVWERSPTTSRHTWFDARLQCTARTTGGRKGWRLPSVTELASLTNPSVPSPGPVLHAGHPFINVQSANYYWSATTTAGSPTSARDVLFHNGHVGVGATGSLLYVWCVRGGMNADAY